MSIPDEAEKEETAAIAWAPNRDMFMWKPAMPGPAEPVAKAVPKEYEEGRTYVTPWDVPEPEPTDPPMENMFPLTTRLAEM